MQKSIIIFLLFATAGRVYFGGMDVFAALVFVAGAVLLLKKY